jgi:hypothetical protein
MLLILHLKSAVLSDSCIMLNMFSIAICLKIEDGERGLSYVHGYRMSGKYSSMLHSYVCQHIQIMLVFL